MSLVVEAEDYPPHAAGVIGMDQAASMGGDFPPLDLDVEPETVEDDAPKRTRRKRADAGTPRTRTTTSSKLAKELAEPLVLIGTMLSMSAPLPGAVIATRADVTAAALVKMAETRPGMMNALKRISQVGPAGELLTTLFMVLIAFQVQSERMRPDSMVAQASGITPLWIELNGQMQAAEDLLGVQPEAPTDQSFGGFGTVPPPPNTFDMPPGMDENGLFHAPPMFVGGRGASMRNQG
jgi:hypothetical protein